MDPTPHLDKADIHLGWLTVVREAQMRHTQFTNLHWGCICDLCGLLYLGGCYLCFLRQYTLRSDSKDKWGLISLKSWNGLDVPML